METRKGMSFLKDFAFTSIMANVHPLNVIGLLVDNKATVPYLSHDHNEETQKPCSNRWKW